MTQIIIRYTQHEHMTYLYQLWEHRHDLEEVGRETNLEGRLEVKLQRLDVMSTIISILCTRTWICRPREDVYVCLFYFFIAVSTITTSTKRRVMFCTISAPLFMASTLTSPAATFAPDGTLGRRDWIDKPAASRHHFCVIICVIPRRGWIGGREQLPVWLCPLEHVVAMVALRLSAV